MDVSLLLFIRMRLHHHIHISIPHVPINLDWYTTLHSGGSRIGSGGGGLNNIGTLIGLGILNLKAQNKCLLAKWLVNLLNTVGMWQTLLRNK